MFYPIFLLTAEQDITKVGGSEVRAASEIDAVFLPGPPLAWTLS